MMSKLPSINRKHKKRTNRRNLQEDISPDLSGYAKPRAAAQSSGYRLRQYEFYCVLGTL